VVVLVGYSMIIVPTGILSAELVESTRRQETTRTCPACTREGHLAEATYCWDCGEPLATSPRPDG
jgi:voltage-gated potassium channel